MVDHAGASSLIDNCRPLTEFFFDFLTLSFFPHDEGTLPPDIGKLVALKELIGTYVYKLSGES